MNKLTSLIFITLSALLLFAGCSTDVEDTVGTDYLLAGYYMIAGDAIALTDDAAGTSRATAPVHQAAWETMSFAQWIADSPVKINNYPERGQKTYVTVKETGTADVYSVSSRTEYPKKEDLFDHYLEEYFVKNEADLNLWDNDDPIVNADGSTDFYNRETMEVVFKDGSIRTEWIADLPAFAGGSVDYAPFPLDGDLIIPAEGWTPPVAETSDNIEYGSKVYYYQKIESHISWYYKENKETFGVRYYTEAKNPDNDKISSSTLTFENTLSRKVSSWGDSDWGEILDWIFGGSSGGTSGETLAETVIREQITENGTKSVKSQTRVVPTFGDAFTIDKAIEYNLLD